MWYDESYRQASIVSVILMCFRSLSGNSAIKHYSHTIFEIIYDARGQTGINPRQGTYIVGVVQIVVASVGIYVAKTLAGILSFYLAIL